MPIELAGLQIELCPWIPEDVDPLQLRICYVVHSHIGIQEIPPSSNRSPYIDRICTKWGAPVGSYWCACEVSECFDLAGARTPPKGLAPSCQEWVKWAKANGLWSVTPGYGYAVVYGNAAGHAHHIGIVTRLVPLETSVEGNTSTGGNFTRNGTAVWPKEVQKAHVLGYVKPIKKAA